jgi:hypothetical protein
MYKAWSAIRVPVNATTITLGKDKYPKEAMELAVRITDSPSTKAPKKTAKYPHVCTNATNFSNIFYSLKNLERA